MLFKGLCTFGFLVFSRNIKWEHWPEMGYWLFSTAWLASLKCEICQIASNSNFKWNMLCKQKVEKIVIISNFNNVNIFSKIPSSAAIVGNFWLQNIFKFLFTVRQKKNMKPSSKSSRHNILWYHKMLLKMLNPWSLGTKGSSIEKKYGKIFYMEHC